MKCSKHKKDLVKNCNWCGEKICKLCIQRKDSIKVYCYKCAPVIGGLRRAKIPAVSPISVPEQKTEEPVGKRQFVLNEEGYLVIK